MKIIFQKSFEKCYKKLPNKIKLKVQERNILFEKNPNDPILNNHALHGKYAGYRSINITGNLRALYEQLNKNTVQFVIIDNHSNLYS
jgi:addiction module RelE/StbE family toxin